MNARTSRGIASILLLLFVTSGLHPGAGFRPPHAARPRKRGARLKGACPWKPTPVPAASTRRSTTGRRKTPSPCAMPAAACSLPVPRDREKAWAAATTSFAAWSCAHTGGLWLASSGGDLPYAKRVFTEERGTLDDLKIMEPGGLRCNVLTYMCEHGADMCAITQYLMTQGETLERVDGGAGGARIVLGPRPIAS